MQVAFIQDPLSSLEEGPIPGHTETVFYTDLGSDVQYVSQYSSIYVRDMSLENGTSISLVNSSKDQVPANNNDYGSGVVLSGDGSLVAFTSGASNLIEGVSGDSCLC